MPQIAVILAGCGSMDGSEIHEATFALAAIEEGGASYQCFALDAPQKRVMNFLTSQEAQGQSRNQLQEAARIARGQIQPLEQLNPNEFEALVIPGGFGVAFNLCSFAQEAEKASVEPLVRNALEQFSTQRKPIGCICIAPCLIALTFGQKLQPKITAGDAQSPAAEAYRKLGCQVLPCDPTECIVDERNLIVSTPAYMNASNISQVCQGIYQLMSVVNQMLTVGAQA